VVGAWLTGDQGGAWVISLPAGRVDGLKEQLRIIWAGQPVEVLWRPHIPAPTLLNV
jgi:hypothetical protein